MAEKYIDRNAKPEPKDIKAPLGLLFRGQTRRKGQKVWMDGTPVASNWVYGGIFPGDGCYSVIYTHEPIDKFPVYSDTVGQYIGLCDKTEKKAFTGDITVDETNRRWVIFACPGGFGVCRTTEWANREDPARFIYEGLSDMQNSVWFTQNHTIIGNIYDDEELLEA